MQDFQEQEIIKPIAFNIIDDNCFRQRLKPFFNQTYHIFSDIAGWKNFVKNYKFAIGNRVHGSILAINSGVPALCLNADSRATEMCQFLKIPHNPKLKIKRKTNLLKIAEEVDISDLNNSYPALYDNFINFLHANKLMSYEENTEIHNQLRYIEQPALSLYEKTFYAKFLEQSLKQKKYWAYLRYKIHQFFNNN